MRAKALFACLLLLLLSGCLPKSKDWVHPQVASPRKEDELFQQDTAFCEGKTSPALQGQERQKALDACLIRLGWQRKE